VTGEDLPTPSISSMRADEGLADWPRLGRYVVARRVELGHRQRPEFAEALGISVRVLGDIERGRRGNYDPATIAALENVLGWETGSAERVVRGGEPALRPSPKAFISFNHDEDEALIRVMRSGLPDSQKRTLVKMLIAEREAADRQRVVRAEELIRLLE
jgi:transcriptional regulator with XRE-family HTH domain